MGTHHINYNDFDAVIFDLDGTLLNSEPLHAQALKITLSAAQSQFNITEKNLQQKYYGHSDTDVFSDLVNNFLEAQSGQDQNHSGPMIQQLIESKNNELENIIQDYDHQSFIQLLTPGIVDYLNLLKKNQKTLAVVSASAKKIVAKLLKKANLAPFFSFSIAKEDTFFSKPAPAPYLLALRKLKISSNNALIFEDSPTGLEAAKLAGAEKIIRIAAFSPTVTLASSTPLGHFSSIKDFSELL